MMQTSARHRVEAMQALAPYMAAVSAAESIASHAPRPLFIGLAGRKRSGKDTAARGLSAVLGLPIDSFAAPLRAFTAHILGMTPEQLEADKETPIDWLDGVTPRHMMQTVGTEWGREAIHNQLWVNSFFRRNAAGAIVSDVRFDNEAEAIIEMGGVVIEIERPGYGDTGDSHASERPISRHLVTAIVKNDGTPAQLVARVTSACNFRA